MITNASLDSTAGAFAQTEAPPFSARRWLDYFEANRENRTAIRFPLALEISAELREPLLRSLQTFQIGETGEGKHLRTYARLLKDPVYEKCIDLFVKEEQAHSRVLAEMIDALDGTLINWHWAALAFIFLRRLFGLKTELLILLIGEIIGKTFYLECARHVKNQHLANAFSLLVIDEIAHLEFHCQFLHSRLGRMPDAARYIIYWGWLSIFSAACCVFIFSHRQTLQALTIEPKSYMRESLNTFNRVAMKALTIPV